MEDDSRPLVVVFGAAGYIGSVLCPMLINAGYNVRAFDNFLYGDEGIKDLPRDHFELIEGDVCDVKSVSFACKDADAIILLAAIVGHRTVDSQRTTNRDINFLASSVVLESAREHGVSRFIFASTNSVYGTQSGLMYETVTPAPISLYSRLKLRLEERIMKAKRRSFHPTSLRLASCYGYSPRMRFDLVANGIMRDAVCKGEITVVSGEQWRPLLHVEDAARSFLLCLNAHENLISGEIFNVGSSEQNFQINQLVNIAKKLVPEAQINVLEGEPDLVDYHLACTKIEKILDFKAQKNLEDSMREIRDLLQKEAFGDPFSLKYQST